MIDPKYKAPQKRSRASPIVSSDAYVLLDLPGFRFSDVDLEIINQSEAGENYARILYTLACRCLSGSDVCVVLEVGTGGSSITFAKALNKSNSGGGLSRLYSVEIDLNRPTIQDVEIVNSLGVDWRTVHGDSLKVPLDKLPSVVDMLYIDGDHGGDHSIGDYRRFSPLVRAGGLIVYDDYPLFSGPEAAVATLVAEGLSGTRLTYNVSDGNSFYVIQK